MEKINKHGRIINMKDLQWVSKETRDFRRYGDYVELFYNRNTGDIWTVLQCYPYDPTEYRRRPDVIKIGDFNEPLTMQEIADEINAKCEYYEQKKQEWMDGTMTYDEYIRDWACKIENLELDPNSRRVDWDVYDPFDDAITHYHTNETGEGIWIGYDYIKQIKGTCDFRLHQATKSGMRKALKKYFN